MRALLGVILTLATLPALAGTELIEEVEAPPVARELPPETSGRVASFTRSTLQVGCEGATSRACRRASTDVQIGHITRINEASGGTAIQETLIGSAR
ncbi:MAG: hypothetical protein KDH20_19025 [Rhodocyclaceae bacterium]|nr:hypothetical protein [Rhodocyclaceae bacterium]